LDTTAAERQGKRGHKLKEKLKKEPMINMKLGMASTAEHTA